MYIGANFHYLHGFDYEHFEPTARLDTDTQGLLTVNPAKGLPVTIVADDLEQRDRVRHRRRASPAWSAHGNSEFGVNGIANRIDWKDAERTNYVLDSLFTGGEFNDFPLCRWRRSAWSYRWTCGPTRRTTPEPGRRITEFGHGYNGTSLPRRL